MIINIHSFLWSKYSTAIILPYLDTMNIWHDFMKILSSFDLHLYNVIPETMWWLKLLSWLKQNYHLKHILLFNGQHQYYPYYSHSTDDCGVNTKKISIISEYVLFVSEKWHIINLSKLGVSQLWYWVRSSWLFIFYYM